MNQTIKPSTQTSTHPSIHCLSSVYIICLPAHHSMNPVISNKPLISHFPNVHLTHFNPQDFKYNESILKKKLTKVTKPEFFQVLFSSLPFQREKQKHFLPYKPSKSTMKIFPIRSHTRQRQRALAVRKTQTLTELQAAREWKTAS